MANFRYHKISKTKKIRYISKICKSSLSIVFLHGFMSDLEGEKPKALLNFAKKIKLISWHLNILGMVNLRENLRKVIFQNGVMKLQN